MIVGHHGIQFRMAELDNAIAEVAKILQEIVVVRINKLSVVDRVISLIAKKKPPPKKT